jgi:RNA recognition motif-containing protein
MKSTFHDIHSKNVAAATQEFPAANPTELFIGGLVPTMTAEELKLEMSQFGQVVSTRILCYKDGRPRGFGFVSFRAEQSAREIVQRKFIQLSSCTVECKLAMSKLESKQQSEMAILRKIQVQGLTIHTEEDLHNYFKQFGEISKIRFCATRKQGSRIVTDNTQAVVTFRNQSSVRSCLTIGQIHRILDSQVWISKVEDLKKTTDHDTIHVASNSKTEHSTRSTSRDFLKSSLAVPVVRRLSVFKPCNISSALKAAILSAQTNENAVAENIEFRLNSNNTGRLTSQVSCARGFRLTHKLCQNAFMFGAAQ